MVELIRRKDVNLRTEDVTSLGKANANIGKTLGGFVERVGSDVQKKYEKDKAEYEKQVQSDIKEEQGRIASRKKAFDASDKLVAADRAGRLENDLLRWNLDQRQKNPNFIGTPDHERAMRDYYAKLTENYSQGLGEAGLGEFTKKTQNSVNNMIGNDIKWAYQQKIKQGEESAKNVAENMNETAGMYGANGDVEGFKESHKENRKKLKDYMDEVAPNGTMPALYELDKKSLINFFNCMAETDPELAKKLLENQDLFKETIPEDMIQNVSDIISNSRTLALNDKLSEVEAGLEETKKKSPAYKQLEKEKYRIEDELKKIAKEDNTERCVQAIYKDVQDAVKPAVEKSLGENALIDKQKYEADKVARFLDFMKLPTPENLKWFEEDNQMSYTPNVENMSEIPEDMKTQNQKNNDLIKNMMKYRENFGNVSMVEISDYKGTRQMFDDLKTVAKTDADKDGNVDNVLLKSLVALNNAKQEEISETDYNNYQNIVNKALFDRTFKNELNQFMDRTENFMPKQFWNKNSNVAFTSNRARLNEKMESKSRDVLSAVLDKWSKGMSGVEASKMYRAGIQKAYNDVTSEALGINMEQIIDDYKNYGFSLANINGRDYNFKGIDSTGNPIWEQVSANGMTAKKLVESAKKAYDKKGE